MSELQNFRLMAQYNQWMNDTLIEAAYTLNEENLRADQGAFFGSIIGTLNHLLIGDIIWLKRFATHPNGFRSLHPLEVIPTPKALNDILYDDLESLQFERQALDIVIREWCDEMQTDDLDMVLHYSNMEGVPSQKRFGALVQHLFNHQTHHRGQLTTLLSQQGVDIGITDLLTLIPDAH